MFLLVLKCLYSMQTAPLYMNTLQQRTKNKTNWQTTPSLWTQSSFHSTLSSRNIHRMNQLRCRKKFYPENPRKRNIVSTTVSKI